MASSDGDEVPASWLHRALRATGHFAFFIASSTEQMSFYPSAPGNAVSNDCTLNTWLSGVHRDDRARVSTALQRAKLGEAVRLSGVRLLDDSGLSRWFDLETFTAEVAHDAPQGRGSKKGPRTPGVTGWLTPKTRPETIDLQHVAELLGEARGADHLQDLSLRFANLLDADAMFLSAFQDGHPTDLRGQLAVLDGRRTTPADIDCEGALAKTVLQNHSHVCVAGAGLRFSQEAWVAQQGLQAIMAYHLRTIQGESLGIVAAGWRMPLQDTTSTQAAMTLFAAYLSSALDGARSERRRFRSLEAFSRHGGALARLSRSEVWRRSERRYAFAEITETGAHTLSVGRVSVWLYDPSRETLVLQDLYDRGADKHSTGAVLYRTQNPSYFDNLDADRSLVAQYANTDPSSQLFTDAYLAPNGVKSLINAPIRVRGRTEGVLFCEETSRHRQWTPEEISFIGSLADYCAMAMAMERRKELEQQLFEAQKTDTIGRLSGGVAHDFNNLLTAITGCAELALDEIQPDTSVHEYLQDILEAAGRGADLTGQLLAFARQGLVKCQVINLNDLIQRTQRILNRLLGEDVALSTRLQADLWAVQADPRQLEQILINLAINARDAMPGGGLLMIESYNRLADPVFASRFSGSYVGQPLVEVRISDTGTGIEAEALRHIFEPFFTTKPAGSGTGLGLAMCEGIVAQAGGYIEADSEPGHGTRFHIFLPRYHAPAQPISERKSYAPSSRTGEETILLIEDDSGVRRIITRGLQSFGYRVVPAASASEALELAQRFKYEIRLVVTDLVMPNMNGRELTIELAKHIPDVKVLYISGYSGRSINRRGLGELNGELLSKPFTPSVLAQRVRKIMDR